VAASFVQVRLSELVRPPLFLRDLALLERPQRLLESCAFELQLAVAELQRQVLIWFGLFAAHLTMLLRKANVLHYEGLFSGWLLNYNLLQFSLMRNRLVVERVTVQSEVARACL